MGETVYIEARSQTMEMKITTDTRAGVCTTTILSVAIIIVP